MSSLGAGIGVTRGRRLSSGPPPDTTPPDPITDLAVVNHFPGGVTLGWIVPGPLGSPPVTFEVRRNADGFVTESDWNIAPSFGVFPSSPPEEPEEFAAGDLNPFDVFIFVVRTRDAAGNLSPFSNQVTAEIT